MNVDTAPAGYARTGSYGVDPELGQVVVELLVDGATLARSEPVSGNDTAAAVRWSGEADGPEPLPLPEGAEDSRLQLRFLLAGRPSLYSWTLKPC